MVLVGFSVEVLGHVVIVAMRFAVEVVLQVLVVVGVSVDGLGHVVVVVKRFERVVVGVRLGVLVVLVGVSVEVIGRVVVVLVVVEVLSCDVAAAVALLVEIAEVGLVAEVVIFCVVVGLAEPLAEVKVAFIELHLELLALLRREVTYPTGVGIRQLPSGGVPVGVHLLKRGD